MLVMATGPTCLNCNADILMLEAPDVSEVIACPDCRTELEVISLDPVQLALAPEVEEDWGE